MAIEPIRVEELNSQCQIAIVKSEPEFVFELHGNSGPLVRISKSWLLPITAAA